MNTRQEFIEEFEEECRERLARLQEDNSELLAYFAENFKEWDYPTPHIDVQGFYLSQAAEELTKIEDELTWGTLDDYMTEYSPKTIH